MVAVERLPLKGCRIRDGAMFSKISWAAKKKGSPGPRFPSAVDLFDEAAYMDGGVMGLSKCTGILY